MSDSAVTTAVKIADRISGTYLDTEITRLENWARAEIERAGVPHENAISTTDYLIVDCVIQGVLSKIARDDNIRKEAGNAFLYQLDCLRKHEWPEPNPEPEPEPTPDPTPGGD